MMRTTQFPNECWALMLSCGFSSEVGLPLRGKRRRGEGGGGRKGEGGDGGRKEGEENEEDNMEEDKGMNYIEDDDEQGRQGKAEKIYDTTFSFTLRLAISKQNWQSFYLST